MITANFMDEDEDIYVLYQREQGGVIILHHVETGKKILLYRSLIKDMLPFLKNFVETGKLKNKKLRKKK